jgi:integrase
MAKTDPTKPDSPRKIKFNRTSITRHSEEKDKTYLVHFDGFPCLRLKVWASGRKVFDVTKKPTGCIAPVTVGLGDFGQIPLLIKEAREQGLTDSVEGNYQAAMVQLKNGLNPNTIKRELLRDAEEKRRQDAAIRYTLQQAFADYLDNSKLSENTLIAYRNAIDNHLEDWKPRELASITSSMVRDRHQQISAATPVVANLVFRVFRAVYSFAEEEIADSTGGEKLLPRNPVKTLSQRRKGAKARWNQESRRTRYIKPDQLKDWIAAVNKLPELHTRGNADRNRDYLLFLITSGCRCMEITCNTEAGTGLLWKHIDLKGGSYTLVSNKSGRPVVLPLTDWQIEILERRKKATKGKGGPFPLVAMRDSIRKVIAETGVEFSLHDLRRSFATYADNQYLHERLIKALLNHSLQQSPDGTTVQAHSNQGDVTAGYIQIEFERLRQAAQQITDYIRRHAGLVNNVVQLPEERRSNRGVNQ